MSESEDPLDLAHNELTIAKDNYKEALDRLIKAAKEWFFMNQRRNGRPTVATTVNELAKKKINEHYTVVIPALKKVANFYNQESAKFNAKAAKLEKEFRDSTDSLEGGIRKIVGNDIFLSS